MITFVVQMALMALVVGAWWVADRVAAVIMAIFEF